MYDFCVLKCRVYVYLVVSFESIQFFSSSNVENLGVQSRWLIGKNLYIGNFVTDRGLSYKTVV